MERTFSGTLWIALGSMVIFLSILFSICPTTVKAIDPNLEYQNCSACVESHCIWCPFTGKCDCQNSEFQVMKECARSVFWVFQTDKELINHNNSDRFKDSICPSLITESHKELCSEHYQVDHLILKDSSRSWSQLVMMIVKSFLDWICQKSDVFCQIFDFCGQMFQFVCQIEDLFSQIVAIVGIHWTPNICNWVVEIVENNPPNLLSRGNGQSFILSTNIQLHNQTIGNTDISSPIGIYFHEFPTRLINFIPANQNPVFSVLNVSEDDNPRYNISIDSNGSDTTIRFHISEVAVFGIPGDYSLGIVVANNRSDGVIQCLFPFQNSVSGQHKLKLQSGLSDIQFQFVVWGLIFLVIAILFVIFGLLLHLIVFPAIAGKPIFMSRLPRTLFQRLLTTEESFRSNSSSSTESKKPEFELEMYSMSGTPVSAHSSQPADSNPEEYPPALATTTEANDQQQHPQGVQRAFPSRLLKTLKQFWKFVQHVIGPWLLKTLKQFWKFVMLSDSKIARKKGSDEAFLLRFHRMLLWISCCCTLFFGIPLAIIYISPSFNADNNQFWKDLSFFSPGNIPDSWLLAKFISAVLNGMILVGIPLAISVLIRVGRKFGPTVVKSTDLTNPESPQYCSACTVRITGISRSCIDSTEFQRHFEEIFGIEKDLPNRIVRAHIVLQDRADVVNWIKKFDNWSAQLKHAEEQLSASGTQVLMHDTAIRTWPVRQFIQRLSHVFRKVPAIPILKERITLAEKRIKHGLGKLQGTGHGFVTFTNPACAAAFLTEVQRSSSFSNSSVALQLNARAWKYSKAPEADDVNWANLGYSHMYRFFMHILSFVLILFTAATITTIIVSVIAFLKTTIAKPEELLSDETTVWEAIHDKVQNVLPTYIPIFWKQLQIKAISYLVPFQGHKTKSSEKKTIFIVSSFTLAYFSVFYPVFFSKDFFNPEFFRDGIASIVPPQNLLFEEMTKILLCYVIGCAFVSKGLLLLNAAVSFVWNGIIKRKRTPAILYEDTISEYVSLANIALIMLMGAQIPVVLLACLLFLAFNYFVDKALIVLVFKKPGGNSRGEIHSTIAWVIGVEALLYTGLFILFQFLQSSQLVLPVDPLALLFVILFNLLQLGLELGPFCWYQAQLFYRTVRSSVTSALKASREEESNSKIRSLLSSNIDETSNVDAQSEGYQCPTVRGCPDIVDRFRQHVADDAIFKALEKEETKQINLRSVLLILGALIFILENLIVLILETVLILLAVLMVDSTIVILLIIILYMFPLILIPLQIGIGIIGIVAGISRLRDPVRFFSIFLTIDTLLIIFPAFLLVVALAINFLLGKIDGLTTVISILIPLVIFLFFIIVILISNGIIFLVSQSLITALTQRDVVRKERKRVMQDSQSSDQI